MPLAFTDLDHWPKTRIPATTEGEPPEIAFDPKYLADALEIGPTLRLVDKCPEPLRHRVRKPHA